MRSMKPIALAFLMATSAFALVPSAASAQDVEVAPPVVVVPAEPPPPGPPPGCQQTTTKTQDDSGTTVQKTTECPSDPDMPPPLPPEE